MDRNSSHALFAILDKFRSAKQIPSPEEVAEQIQKQDLAFAPGDVAEADGLLCRSLGFRGLYPVPQMLLPIVSDLVRDCNCKSVCDPWASRGGLLGSVLQAANATTATAIVQNASDYAVGKVLLSTAHWHLGNPLEFIASLPEQDAIVSILPFGAKAGRALVVKAINGKALELRDDLGNLILLASAMRLGRDGIGIYVVTPSFFFASNSVFRHFGDVGLGVAAALAIPASSFAPYTNIPTYLVVVRRQAMPRMFVAQLSADARTNLQIISNLREGKEGGALELGKYVNPEGFVGIDSIRIQDRLEQAERTFGAPAIAVEDLAMRITLGRPGDDFRFPAAENAVLVPLVGISDVVDSQDDMTLKAQNYAQVAIDSSRSHARFVAQFLNSELGKEIRERNKTGTVIPKLNTQGLKRLSVFLPSLQTQQSMLEIETRLAAERNTLLGLQNEVAQLHRELWGGPDASSSVERRLSILSGRLSGGLKQHAATDFDHWIETLPFPMASILRAWQATPSQDFKTKHEHLLHFFEATAEFVSVILLSAFTSNEALFGPHKRKLFDAMEKAHLSFRRATFGTWKLVVEYLGKQTRELLRENRALCADIFADASLDLPVALSRTELAVTLSRTNKLRNDWSGHGGVVGQEEAQLRNEQLLGEVQALREAIADTWVRTQLIRALHTVHRRGIFENEIAVLMGSNSEFLKETRPMAISMDVERIYLSVKGALQALKLLPLIQIGSSPQYANNACYFFSRLERDGARFVSYHYADRPELKGQFDDATETIKSLAEVGQS